MIKKTPLFIVIFSTFLFLVEGCIPSKPTEDIELLPSERLINKLEVNRRKIRNFEGNGVININSNKGKYNATFHIALQKPDSIAFTILGPFGIEVAQALITNENFTFYNALENTAYKGDLDSEILKEIFKVNLSFGDLVDAFVGSVNLSENLYKPPSDYKIDYDEYVLTYVDSVDYTTSTYRVDVRELGITSYEVSDELGEIIEGKYSRFELLENVAVPYNINLQNKRENQIINIEYRNMAANQRNLNIQFDIPRDASVIRW